MSTIPFEKHILCVITGSIAAYKTLDVIRLLQQQHCNVTCVLTKSAKEFITPLSVASITGNAVYDDLFSLKDESEMGHIQLSRQSDLILVAPASANIIAKMAHGLADDLASTVLLAADKPIFVAPAMNSKMWQHPAVQRNISLMQADGAQLIAPEEGELACGEFGQGRMASPQAIVDCIFNPNDEIKQCL